ncbi:MAG: hypothetical protein WBN04_03440 [Paracoccaceae bacterium]
MAILIDKSTRVICQDFTGSEGTFRPERAITANSLKDAARKVANGVKV